MKNKILPFILFLFPSIILHAEKSWPLQIQADDDWNIEYENQGVQFFTITRPEGENVLLMFSRWPAPGGKEQIPTYIKQMAEGFLTEMEKQEELKSVQKAYKIVKINGVEFSGEAAVFQIEGGMLQTMFMVSDGDGIWNGQYTGSPEIWEKAKVILMNLKKG